MPWSEPPQHLRARVNEIIGGDIYAEAARRYLRVVEAFGRELPTTEAGASWYRDPAHHARLEGAARYSQHLLGLARDWQIRDAAERRRAMELLRREGFTVFEKSRGRVHAQVLTPEEFRRFLPRFQGLGVFRSTR